jgi:putative transposase
MSISTIPWPHAPIHELGSTGVYMITAATVEKLHHFRGRDRLTLLQNEILSLTAQFRWQLQAWSVFSNHYHFVARSNNKETTAEDLTSLLRTLHARTAWSVNQADNASGRHVWHNFWDTRIGYKTSYFARLNYVHQNAVKHGLVTVARSYPWCSAQWFENAAPRVQVRTIYRFKTDRVTIFDDFEPTPPGNFWSNCV